MKTLYYSIHSHVETRSLSPIKEENTQQDKNNFEKKGLDQLASHRGLLRSEFGDEPNFCDNEDHHDCYPGSSPNSNNGSFTIHYLSPHGHKLSSSLSGA